MSEAVIIGGPLDGSVTHVNTLPEFVERDDTGELVHHHYRQERFKNGPISESVFFIHSSLTNEAAFRRLLKRYTELGGLTQEQLRKAQEDARQNALDLIDRAIAE